MTPNGVIGVERVNARLHILSSVFDFLCAANFNFVRGGLAKFARAHARSLEGTLLEGRWRTTLPIGAS